MIKSFNGKTPRIAASAFVSQSAHINGDVEIGEHCGIWPGVIIRADYEPIRIGSHTDIEDGAIVHAGDPMVIGDHVTIGHGAIIHARRIGDNVLIGMGATVLENVEIGEGAVIAAGAVVTERAKIPPNSFVVGIPAEVRGEIPEEKKQARLKRHTDYYVPLRKMYKEQGI